MAARVLSTRGASWGVSSCYLGCLGFFAPVLPGGGLAGIVTSLLAIAFGIAGLAFLRLQASVRWSECETAADRVAFKIAKRGRKRGYLGIALGVVNLILLSVILSAA